MKNLCEVEAVVTFEAPLELDLAAIEATLNSVCAPWHVGVRPGTLEQTFTNELTVTLLVASTVPEVAKVRGGELVTRAIRMVQGLPRSSTQTHLLNNEQVQPDS